MMRLELVGQNLFVYAGRKPKCGPMIKNRPPLESRGPIYVEKDPDAGKDGRRKEKGVTEDEMAGWHH